MPRDRLAVVLLQPFKVSTTIAHRPCYAKQQSTNSKNKNRLVTFKDNSPRLELFMVLVIHSSPMKRSEAFVDQVSKGLEFFELDHDTQNLKEHKTQHHFLKSFAFQKESDGKFLQGSQLQSAIHAIATARPYWLLDQSLSTECSQLLCQVSSEHPQKRLRAVLGFHLHLVRQLQVCCIKEETRNAATVSNLL